MCDCHRLKCEHPAEYVVLFPANYAEPDPGATYYAYRCARHATEEREARERQGQLIVPTGSVAGKPVSFWRWEPGVKAFRERFAARRTA